MAFIIIGFFAFNYLSDVLLNNPDKRNEQRSQDISNILGAIDKYVQEDEGARQFLFDSIKFCGEGYVEIGTDDRKLNLVNILVPSYIERIPQDLQTSNGASGYEVCRSFDGSLYQIRAINAEDIEVAQTLKFE